MNSRQRVLRALRGEPVDRVPRGEISLDDEFIRALMGFRHRRALIGPVEQNAAIAALDLDLITIDATTGAQGLSNDVDRARLRRAGAWRGSGLAVFVRADGPLDRLVKTLGAQGTLARFTGRKTRPFGTLDMVAAQTRAAVDRVAAAGADAILVADVHPDITGELASPDHLRRFYLPSLASGVHAAHARHLPVFVHVAAWHWPVLDELAALGPDGLQGLADSPLGDVRARVGPDICLWGNAEQGWLAQPHPAAEIAAEAQRLLAGGGLRCLFGTAAGLCGGLNIQTVISLYEAAAAVLPAPERL